MERPPLRVSAVTLSSPNPNALAVFYARLLGWAVVDESPGWVRIRPPAGGMGLSFHGDEHYVRPVWPPADGAQTMQMHLDIGAPNPDAVAWAIECGATEAEHQPQPQVKVMLDPDGHPFCLFGSGPRGEFDTVDWHGVES